MPHLAALDGVRAVAVLAVMLFHGGVSWAGGGFLGVEVFFVLSGFLITSLLVREWLGSGSIALRSFWARRARRLLPALFLLVTVIGIYYAAAGPAAAVPGLKGDGLSALLYFNNWHQIAVGAGYFAQSGPVSPFQHTWSLSIEEQFYLVWPLLLLGVLGWVFRRGRGRSQLGALRLAMVLVLLALLASALEIAILFGAAGLDRVYYGTDTRATGLLAGAALALWMAIRERRLGAPSTARAGSTLLGSAHGRLRIAGVVGLTVIALLFVTSSGSSGWLYPYGLLVIDAATVAVIAAIAVAPGAGVERILRAQPVQALGAISYGLYLWHFPLFLWLNAGNTGLTGVHLLMFRIGVTLLVAACSYVFVEQPIRQRRLPAVQVRRLAPAAALAAVLALLVGASISSLPTGLSAAARAQARAVARSGALSTLRSTPAGTGAAASTCAVELRDTRSLGLAPVPPEDEARFEDTTLGRHQLTWSGQEAETFHVCPPRRILLVGDSISFTIGVPILSSEQSYGVELANAANLGCAFATRGQLDVNGTWQRPAPTCQRALANWSADERSFHPSEVVVEMGYRDEFDWQWGGRIVHLGQASFDTYEQQQIERYVDVLGQGGTKILFLTVPYTDPPRQPDGAPAPAASSARHAEINLLLQEAAAAHPGQVSVLGIDQTISPGGHYQASVNGQLCRFDGIHFTVYCAELLEPQVLSAAHALLRWNGAAAVSRDRARAAASSASGSASR